MRPITYLSVKRNIKVEDILKSKHKYFCDKMVSKADAPKMQRA